MIRLSNPPLCNHVLSPAIGKRPIATTLITPITFYTVRVIGSCTRALMIRLPLVARVMPVVMPIPVLVVISGVAKTQPQVRLTIIEGVVIAVVVIGVPIVPVMVQV